MAANALACAQCESLVVHVDEDRRVVPCESCKRDVWVQCTVPLDCDCGSGGESGLYHCGPCVARMRKCPQCGEIYCATHLHERNSEKREVEWCDVCEVEFCMTDYCNLDEHNTQCPHCYRVECPLLRGRRRCNVCYHLRCVRCSRDTSRVICSGIGVFGHRKPE